MSLPDAPQVLGRYAVHGEIASGGMASVHYGRLLGQVGFSRTVAIKRLHSHFARDPDFVSMFVDEARVVARIHHPNVVQTLDVVASDGDLLLVMEYVHGEALARLLRDAGRRHAPVPLPIASAIICAALRGLHAAHEAKTEQGVPLGVVHRDISPQNILVGADGNTRVLDFGVAKATGRLQSTRDGQLKGKLAYMAVEQLRAGEVDRRTDVYAMGVVLWELLTLRRLFQGDSEAVVVTSVLEQDLKSPSTIRPDLPPELDAIAMRALQRDPAARFPTARAMADALEAAMPPASVSRVADWLEDLAGQSLAERARAIADIESGTSPGISSADVGQITGARARFDSSLGTPTGAGVAAPSNAASHAPAKARGWSKPAKLVALGVVGGALLGVGTFAALAMGRDTSATGSGSPPPGGSAITAATASAAGLVTTTSEVPSASAPAEVIAVEPSAPAATSTMTRRPPGLAVGGRAFQTKTPTPAPSAKKTPACVTRQYVDDQGILHFNKECN